MKQSETGTGGEFGGFRTTAWSILGRARDPASPERVQALERLAALYWKPVYCLIRQSWKKGSEDAKDLTQEFFLQVLLDGRLLERYAPERGSFRRFLKAALRNFLRDDAKTAGRDKRGGDRGPLRLPEGGVEMARLAPRIDDLSPDQVFEISWRKEVMARSLERLEERLRSQGKADAFDLFRRYELASADDSATYRALAGAAGMSVDDVKNRLTLARREFREAVIDVVSEYVESEADLQDELSAILGRGP